MENTKNKFYSLLFILCLFLLFISLPFNLFIKDENVLLCFMAVARLIFVFLSLYFVKKDHLFLMQKQNRISKEFFWFIPFLLMCGSNFFVLFFTDSFTFQFQTKTFIFYFIFYLSVAISEECLFRYIIMNYLCLQFSSLKTILLSSLIFGGIHLVNFFNGSNIFLVLVQCVYSFALGLVLSFLYIRVKNIFLPILFHFCFNIVNDTLFSFVHSEFSDLLYYLVNVIIALILIGYGLFLWKHFKREDDVYVS